jgi:hypothetical protein
MGIRVAGIELGKVHRHTRGSAPLGSRVRGATRADPAGRFRKDAVASVRLAGPGRRLPHRCVNGALVDLDRATASRRSSRKPRPRDRRRLFACGRAALSRPGVAVAGSASTGAASLPGAGWPVKRGRRFAAALCGSVWCAERRARREHRNSSSARIPKHVSSAHGQRAPLPPIAERRSFASWSRSHPDRRSDAHSRRISAALRGAQRHPVSPTAATCEPIN